MDGYNPNIVAKAVRIEVDENSNRFYIVFEVTDPSFKKDILKDWMNDVDLEIIGKNLVKKE